MRNSKASDQNYLSRAAAVGQKGIRGGYGGPFGAVIVRKGKILAEAHNTVLKSKDPSAHAEINAIRQASKKIKKWDLSDTTIYSSTEPCPMCFSAIHWARIPRIIYGTGIPDVKKLGFNELSISNQRLKKLGRSQVKIKSISNKDCLLLLKSWAQLPKKNTY